MSSHERFEELCALAAAGELGPADHDDLIAHVEECASCRTVFEELKDIHATWLPQREGFEIKRSFAAESKVRQLILRQAAAEGGNFSEEARLPRIPVVHPARRPFSYSYKLPAAAAAVLIAVAGFAIRGHLTTPRPASPASATQNALVVKERDQSAEIEELREEVGSGQLSQARLESSLERAQADRRQLEQKLDSAERRAGTLEESARAATEQISALENQLDTARADEVKVAGQLAEFKASTSDAQTELALLETENKDLRDKLDAQTASVDRERELMADGREIRDLIAARNLHIIDVYDTSGEGRTQKSFGRVFYTEGKSLVFYAYDLPARRGAAKYAFYAWGKRDVSGDVKVRNLGIFYNDDQAQKRWVLKVSDPNVLSEIDSVFVTLEKTDSGGENVPTGRKLLSA